jgi:hypothetical protein
MAIRLTPTRPKQNLLLKVMLLAGLACAFRAPLYSKESQTPDWQIAAGGKMAFDVATVRRTTNAPSANALYSNFPLGPGNVYISNGGQLRAMNFPLIAYIEFAYKIT